ncbi:MAG: tetratricopeptide repeat protein, partial [Candidatus Woesearchaeota archaeon]
KKTFQNTDSNKTEQKILINKDVYNDVLENLKNGLEHTNNLYSNTLNFINILLVFFGILLTGIGIYISVMLYKNDKKYKDFSNQKDDLERKMISMKNLIKDAENISNELIEKRGQIIKSMYESDKKLSEAHKASENIKGLKNQAYDLLINRKYDSALSLYKEITKTEPDYIYGWIQKGYCNLQLGDINEARNSFKKAISINQSNYDALTYIADCFYLKSLFTDSLKYINKALEIKKNDKDSLLFRISIWNYFRSYIDALNDFQTLIVDYPNDIQILLKRAEFYMKYKEHQKAYLDIDSVLKIEPSNQVALQIKNEINNLYKPKFYKEFL